VLLDIDRWHSDEFFQVNGVYLDKGLFYALPNPPPFLLDPGETRREGRIRGRKEGGTEEETKEEKASRAGPPKPIKWPGRGITGGWGVNETLV